MRYLLHTIIAVLATAPNISEADAEYQLDLEGYEIVKEVNEQKTIFDPARGIIAEVKKAFFRDAIIPPGLQSLTRKFCGKGTEVKSKLIEDYPKARKWELICQETKANSEWMYTLAPSATSTAVCKKVSRVNRATWDRSPKSYYAKTACPTQGWLEHKVTDADGSADPNWGAWNSEFTRHLFIGDAGLKTCQQVAKEMRDSSFFKEIVSSKIDWQRCEDNDQSRTCANGIALYASPRLNCDAGKDQDFIKATRNYKNVQEQNKQQELNEKQRIADTIKQNGGELLIESCENNEQMSLALQENAQTQCDGFDSACNHSRRINRDRLLDRWKQIIARFERLSNKKFTDDICCQIMPDRFIKLNGTTCVAKPVGMRYGL